MAGGIFIFQIVMAVGVMTWYGASVLRFVDDMFRLEFKKYITEEAKKNPSMLQKDNKEQEQLAFKINDNFYLKDDTRKGYGGGESGSFARNGDKRLRFRDNQYENPIRDRNHHQQRHFQPKSYHSYDQSQYFSYHHDDVDDDGGRSSIRSGFSGGAKGGRDLKTQASFKEFQVGDHLNFRHGEDSDKLGEKGSLDFSKGAFLSDDDTYKIYSQESFDDETGDPLPLPDDEHFRLNLKSIDGDDDDHYIRSDRNVFYSLGDNQNIISVADIGGGRGRHDREKKSSTGNKEYSRSRMSDTRGLHPSIRTIQNDDGESGSSDDGDGIKSTCSSSGTTSTTTTTTTMSDERSQDFLHFPQCSYNYPVVYQEQDNFDKNLEAPLDYSKYEEEGTGATTTATSTSAFYSALPSKTTTTTSSTSDSTATTTISTCHDQSQSIHFDKEANLVKEKVEEEVEEDDVKVEESALNEDRKNGKVNSDGFNFHFEQNDDVCLLPGILIRRKEFLDRYEDDGDCNSGGGGGGSSGSGTYSTTYVQDEVDV